MVGHERKMADRGSPWQPNRAVPERRPGAELSNPVAAITDPHSDRYRRLTAESRVTKPRFPRAFSGHSCDRVFDKIKGIRRFIFTGSPGELLLQRNNLSLFSRDIAC